MPVVITSRFATPYDVGEILGVSRRRVNEIIKRVNARHQGTSKRASALRKRNVRAKVSKRAG
jgi:hypothetical protein